MTELFRYIEQSFALPDSTGSIDTQSDSTFQTNLRRAVSQHQSPDRIRAVAGQFLDDNFLQGGEAPVTLADQLLSFARQLQALASPSKDKVEKLVQKVFGMDASTLAGSDNFLHDKDLLNDALVSIKLTTGFDRVNAADLATMRQAVAFLDDLASDKVAAFAAADLRDAFRKPIRIPKLFVDALQPTAKTSPPPPPDSGNAPADKQRAALLADQQALRSAYETIMSLQPHEFELKSVPARDAHAGRGEQVRGSPAARSADHGQGASPAVSTAHATAPMALTLSAQVLGRLGPAVKETLEKSAIDVANTPVSSVVASIRKQWQNVSGQLAPYQIPAAAPVVRVGVHVFALQAPA